MSGDAHTAGILQACYGALLAGDEPDLTEFCGDALHLRSRVERLLHRERQLLGACACLPGFAPESPPPERIGDFVILEPLGAGGMGRVFRARHEPRGCEVAVKIMRDGAMSSLSMRLRFRREAEIAAMLHHPNIVPVLATGEEAGRAYIVMKRLRGRSLDRVPLPLALDEVVGIGTAVADALHAAHEVGVLHRDVKPANIVVENGVPFVLDFGLARLRDATADRDQANGTAGTLIYMAPELLRHEAPEFDPRADVYGLGATLYELLSGVPPFSTLRHVLFREPPPLRLPRRYRSIEAVVLRALEKDPRRRPPSATAMANELRRCLAPRPIRPQRIRSVRRTRRSARRRPAPSTLVDRTAQLLVTLGVAIRSLRGGGRADVTIS